MPIDFEKSFGVNAGYVETLFDQWQASPSDVEASWASYFERVAPRADGAPGAQATATGAQAAGPGAAASVATAAAPASSQASSTPAAEPAKPAESADDEYDVQPLRGLMRSIAQNMQVSLTVPTATTVRTLPVKVLGENRRLLNNHLTVRALGKASFTHLVAFAMVRALREDPGMQASYAEVDGKSVKRTPRHVNLGIAIDMEMGGERALVVPNIKRAEELSFQGFFNAFNDVVARGRKGKLVAADFKGTTASLTNPGGMGTQLSVPRLMEGQGLIVATGSIGVPPETANMAKAMLANLAIGPVMTATSTYDHRVIQGAQSAVLLRRMEQLLNGADNFYDEIFEEFRVPWRPAKGGDDQRSDEPAGDVQAKVWALINAYRLRGSKLADLNPLEYKPELLPSLDPEDYGFSIWDLDREFLVGDLDGRARMTLREALDVLRQSYCRRWTMEYMHITDRTRKHWLRNRIESHRNDDVFSQDDRRRILRGLYEAQNFEQFLHKRYVGNKRFSLEGSESLIPALAELIERVSEKGAERIVIGMAHRGRLNVLTNILGKSYAQVFREFEGVLLPLRSEGSGDVKYHLGQKGSFKTKSGSEVEVLLAANPSHLEAVDPVVCGMARGYQDELKDRDRKRVVGVLVHGDAAFSGQGVVAETLNMSDLPAYRTGGTIHVVVNNQIGFTASPRDLRSTDTCTDIAKSVQAPILRANGNHPEAVLKSMQLAVDYQREFGGDVVLDLVCYRRWGHNEGDEPAFTQPLMVSKIQNHPTVVEHYRGLLERSGALSADDCDAVCGEVDRELREAVDELEPHTPDEELPVEEIIDLTDDDELDWSQTKEPVTTGIPAEHLTEWIETLNVLPDDHVTHPNLLRQLSRRERMVRGEQGLDWGCAEALAFASIVKAGTPIRLVGQDSGRGTFSHRHAVIRDQETEADYIPLNDLGEDAGRFEVRDSLLSEEAALAFEWGYSVVSKRSLVLWEAQFGDFVNGAQIPIDQFLVSSETKWRETSGLVLLLPHGFDGQGPEHSSARIERFLTACANGNLTVCNCTTSAQYFHLLRRQAGNEQRRPLIIFTPKSLLRDHRAASDVVDFTRGGFRELISEGPSNDPVRRIVLCSGKVYYDLIDHRTEHEHNDTLILRMEQLYPFPLQALQAEFAKYPDAKIVWCQEEPKNMGPFTFVYQRLTENGHQVSYAGRPMSPSPATGSYTRHKAEQDHLVKKAFRI